MHRSVRLCYFRKPDIRLVTQPWKELKLGTKESKRKRGPCRKPKEIGSSAMKFWEESILRMPSVLKCWQRENKVPRVIFPPPPFFFQAIADRVVDAQLLFHIKAPIVWWLWASTLLISFSEIFFERYLFSTRKVYDDNSLTSWKDSQW